MEAALFYQRWISAEEKLKEDEDNLRNHEVLVNDQTTNVAKLNVNFEEQQNKIPNSIQAGALIVPVAAVHPPTGANAPGIEPSNVFQVVYFFSGV